VPHVELSILDAPRRLPPEPPSPSSSPSPEVRAVEREPTQLVNPQASLKRWSEAVASADEPCLVLNREAVILAASASCAEMIGLGDAVAALGRPLREALVDLIDFNDSPDKLDSAEADKIPPLLAISSRRLARGLMRLQCPRTGTTCTMDAIATPLWDGTEVTGSLSFFSKI
jgi:PAS domain-containing protein